MIEEIREKEEASGLKVTSLWELNTNNSLTRSAS